MRRPPLYRPCMSLCCSLRVSYSVPFGIPVPFGRKDSAGRRAFTLIELLVVISIIALLVSILLPALKQARETAKFAQCMSQQRQIILGVTNYAVDHDGSYPYSVAQRPTNPAQFSLPGVVNYNNQHLKTYLGAYISTPQIMVCPLAPKGSTPLALYESMPVNGGTFSYNFLWNYKQWDEKRAPGWSAYGKFVAAGSMDEVGVSDLIIGDMLNYSTPGPTYFSAHPSWGQSMLIDGGNAVYTNLWNYPSSTSYSFGYRDGSVRTNKATELKENKLGWVPSLSIYLPE